MLEGQKIQTRTDVILFVASWTAGVEYDNEQFEEIKYDPDYDSNEERNENEDMSIKSNKYNKIDQNELANVSNDQYVLEQETEIE